MNSSVYQNGPKKTKSRNASIVKMDNIHHKTTDGIFWKGTTDEEMDGKNNFGNTFFNCSRHNNELKAGKKSILATQYTLCLKG